MKKIALFIVLCAVTLLAGCDEKANKTIVFYPAIISTSIAKHVDVARMEQTYRAALEDLYSYNPESISADQWSFQFKHINPENTALYEKVKSADGRGLADYTKEHNVGFYLTTELFSPSDGLPFANIRVILFIPAGNFRKRAVIATRIAVDDLYSPAFWQPLFLQFMPLFHGDKT